MRSKVALYFLVCLMTVTGCVIFSPVEHGEIEAEGVIEVLEVSTWMYGTHILLNDDGVIMIYDHKPVGVQYIEPLLIGGDL